MKKILLKKILLKNFIEKILLKKILLKFFFIIQNIYAEETFKVFYRIRYKYDKKIDLGVKYRFPASDFTSRAWFKSLKPFKEIFKVGEGDSIDKITQIRN